MTDLRVPLGSDIRITAPTFTSVDEAATDTTATATCVAVSRATGDTLTAPTVTAESGAGAYTAILTAAVHTASVDLLDLTWSGVIATYTRTLTQTVEVAGDVYVPTVDLRAITALSNTTTHPNEKLRRLRTEAEQIIERARGTAYVTRCAVESFVVDRSRTVRLANPHASSLVRVTVNGTDQTLADYEIDADVRRVDPDGGFWVPGDEVTIAYLHGHTRPPQALCEAVKEYVRAKAVAETSDQQRDVISFTNLATGEAFRFSTPDWSRGRYTGIEAVDSRINSVADERVPLG